ncbi:MAG: SPOR domain-containing protein [Rhizobiaceae bacterium]|nr:SPOR domain-containing protein [Rhizobiaceae bacterium]
MSERTDQNPPVESGSRNDPLAELARIVAGENPVEVTAPRLMADANNFVPESVPGMEAEAQVGFGDDPALEAVPVQAPHVPTDDITAGDDFDLEASLEDQLMQEFDVAGIDEALAANPADPDIPGLREVETLAEEFVNKTTINETPVTASFEASVPRDNYDVTQEFASEVVPSHLAPTESGVAYDKSASAGAAGGVVASPASSISIDLDDDFDAKFEEIAQQAAAVDDLQLTAAEIDGGLNLEAEFESAFASELDQNDILPEASTPFVAPPVGEFETPFSGNGDGDGLAGPEHLSDPAMFDESVPTDELGAAATPLPRRSGFKMAALALGIALLGGFAAVGYGFFSNSGGDGAPIVVMADPGEIKIKPEDRGGIVIANQDKASYAEISGNAEEGSQDRLFSGTETANEPPKVSALEPKFEERLTPGSSEPAEKIAAIAPRKVRTFTVRPDGTIITPDPEPLLTGTPLIEPLQTRSLAALQPTETSLGAPIVEVAAADPVIVAPRQVETVKVEPPVAVEAAPPIVEESQQVAVVTEAEAPVEIVNIAPEPIDGASAASGDIAVPQQSPLPKPVKVSAPAPSRATVETKLASQNDAPVQLANAPAPTASIQPITSNSPWAIQISSQRSREGADASYQNLLRRFPSLLNGRSFDIREAQVSGKGTFFRVRIQADSKQAASSFCTQFKSSGGSCFITR